MKTAKTPSDIVSDDGENRRSQKRAGASTAGHLGDDAPGVNGMRIPAGGARRGAGRKLIEIDLVELEKLASLQCTDEELAAWFGVSTRTIENRRKRPSFAAALARGKAKGRISVRRAQMKLLESGNATMGVWLGKQFLGQRDSTPVELSGPNGKPVQISLEAINEILTRTRQREADISGRTADRSGD